jgi:alkylated DNA nucleotide flippase Atl1
MAPGRKKTWKQKLADNKDLPKIENIPARMQKNCGRGTMVIPSPKEVDAIMKKIPSGKVVTINRIRKKIARKHHADIACPVTTGIFSWIAAHAADEDIAAGSKNFTPFWRTLKEGGVINEKYPGGIERQAMLLEAEGHTIIQKGEKWIVENWEDSLA